MLAAEGCNNTKRNRSELFPFFLQGKDKGMKLWHEKEFLASARLGHV